MSVTGKIKNGVVILSPGTTLPEGTEVKVETLPSATADPLVVAIERLAKPRPHLPEDYALNHGQPRQGRWIPANKNTPELSERQAAEFGDKLLELARETANLPADLSTNHDHYLHGLPKR